MPFFTVRYTRETTKVVHLATESLAEAKRVAETLIDHDGNWAVKPPPPDMADWHEWTANATPRAIVEAIPDHWVYPGYVIYTPTDCDNDAGAWVRRDS